MHYHYQHSNVHPYNLAAMEDAVIDDEDEDDDDGEIVGGGAGGGAAATSCGEANITPLNPKSGFKVSD
jgi:thioredoxin reductase